MTNNFQCYVPLQPLVSHLVLLPILCFVIFNINNGNCQSHSFVSVCTGTLKKKKCINYIYDMFILNLPQSLDCYILNLFYNQHMGVTGQTETKMKHTIDQWSPTLLLEIPSYRLQFQPFFSTPVCNYQVALNTLISWFRCV